MDRMGDNMEKNNIFEDLDNTQPISFNIEEGSNPNINTNLNVDPTKLGDSSVKDLLDELNITKKSTGKKSKKEPAKAPRKIRPLDPALKKEFIRVKNVVKEYGTDEEAKTLALNDISFTIDEGELVIFLGQSGAGKTTALNMIGGMDNVTSGRIIVGDKEITEYDEEELTEYRRGTIGFVFQLYNLVANLTAEENVALSTEISKDSIDAKIMLDEVGLADKYDKLPSQLSGGEQQRVAIARAMAKKPKLLLCDEPTGALDYVTGKQVLDLIQRTNRDNNITTIIITHNQAITPMADKVIKFKSGKITDVSTNPNPIRVEDIEW